MKRMLVALAILASPLALAAAEWTLDLQAAEVFGKPGAFPPSPVTDNAGRAFLASSCADLARGFQLPEATTLDIRESAARTEDCAALRLQLSARQPKKPAFESYALTEKSLDELPPCFEPMVSPDEKASDPGTKSLRQASRTARASTDGAALRIADAGYSARVQIAGRGDVNADGLDDVVLRSDWALEGGSLGGSSTLVLTRKPGESVLRVLSDSGGRCLASSLPPPIVCGEATGKRIRADFQKRYDKKDYASAYELLDGFLAGCAADLPPLARSWMQNDLALTAHHLGRDARCLEIAADAGLQDVGTPEEAALQKAVESNIALCEKSIRCTAPQVTAARSAFKKLLDKGDAKGATASLDAFMKGCDGSVERTAHAWALSDLAFAANKAGDKDACSGYLDTAERIALGEGDSRIAAALAANRKNCPRPKAIAVSTPVSPAAPAAGALTLTWIGHCEGDPAAAAIVTREEAPNAKAPFCVRLDAGAFDPFGLNSAEVDVPGWESMRSPRLLIETASTEPLVVIVSGERSVPVCTECDGGCVKVKEKKTFLTTRTATPAGGRHLFDAGPLVEGGWHLVGVKLDVTVTQKASSAKSSLKLDGWPWCM